MENRFGTYFPVYELHNIQGRPITLDEARRLILTNYQVPEEIKRERRRRKTA